MEIQLRSHQVECSTKVQEAFQDKLGIGINAPTGSGKTYVAYKTAQECYLDAYVVCPATLRETWKKVAKEYGINLINAISYTTLAGQAHKNPKHGLLLRRDNKVKQKTREITVTTFTPTQELKDLLCRGVLFIFDESHNLKNDVAKTKASIAITKAILETGGASRYLLLSATFFDKEKHVIQMLRVFGYLENKKLAQKVRGKDEYELLGLQEVLNVAGYYDPEATQEVLDMYPGSALGANAEEACYQLWLKVFLKSMVFSMPLPTTVHGYLDIKNGYYKICSQKVRALTEGIRALNNAMVIDDKTVNNFGAITKALVAIEKAKIWDIVRVARKTLEEKPICKVIIAINYLDHIAEAEEMLSDYNPLIFTGAVSFKKREEVSTLFQQGDLEYRVLIMNPTVGGVGVSFHDEVGDFPRYMFISPSYLAITIIQATGRVHRDGKGVGICRLFYGAGLDSGDMEMRLLSNLHRKGEIIKDSTGKNTVTLPCDYEKEEEK